MLVDKIRDSSLLAYFSSQREREESLCLLLLRLSTQSNAA
jgi:hypothetical protein